MLIITLFSRDSPTPGALADPIQAHFDSWIDIIRAEPAELELLIAEYQRTPRIYEQMAARSIAQALHNWRVEMAEEEIPYAE